MPSEADIWVLADDRPGNVAQAMGVAEALGRPFQVKEVAYDRFGGLPNWFKGPGLLGIKRRLRDSYVAPWPKLVIAAGRRTATLALYIKMRAIAERAPWPKLVQIMDPDWRHEAFDLLVVPSHDRPPPRDNQLVIAGAPHLVTAEKLDAARSRFASALADLPSPRIAVMVGGATKRRGFSPAIAASLGRLVTVLAQESGGSLMVTTSRRTGNRASRALFNAINAPHVSWTWGDEGDNPYLGYLAHADAIVVTGDSVSMVSEACGAGKPVYVFAPAGSLGRRHERMLEAVFAAVPGAGPLNSDTMGEPLRTGPCPPFNPAGQVALAIEARLGL